jgi:hypothetical protein
MLIFAVLVSPALSIAESLPKGAVAELLEDNGEALLKQLTNPTGDPGDGQVEKTVVFSGQSSVKIIPMQRFHPTIPGWKYRITEKPKHGEYRYLRFAWKADGCAGIMLQLHDEKDWTIRYTAGVDRFNWGTKFVADQPPSEWTIVTCDIHKDFGERTITGIALTAFDGQAAYFDHIYLAQTIEDLDRIDATGFRKGKQLEISQDDLKQLWVDLGSSNASKAYLAFWRLVTAPKQVVPFLKSNLTGFQARPDTNKIRQWINELDDDRFTVREGASEQLAHHLDAAVSLLEDELRNTASAEVQARIKKLLSSRKNGASERNRIEKVVRILEYVETAETREFLKELAKGTDGDPIAEAARQALKRIAVIVNAKDPRP